MSARGQALRKISVPANDVGSSCFRCGARWSEGEKAPRPRLRARRDRAVDRTVDFIQAVARHQNRETACAGIAAVSHGCWDFYAVVLPSHSQDDTKANAGHAIRVAHQYRHTEFRQAVAIQ
jgi:hypothetical protein